jgi:hypothetical protein
MLLGLANHEMKTVVGTWGFSRRLLRLTCLPCFQRLLRACPVRALEHSSGVVYRLLYVVLCQWPATHAIGVTDPGWSAMQISVSQRTRPKGKEIANQKDKVFAPYSGSF